MSKRNKSMSNFKNSPSLDKKSSKQFEENKPRENYRKAFQPEIVENDSAS